MNLRLLIFSFAALLLTACSSGSQSQADLEDLLRQAEGAAAYGDMRVAKSVATNLIGDENLSQLSAKQLGRLSLVYMQLADSDETNAVTAADLYKRAFTANADSATAYYQGVDPEKLGYVSAMQSLASTIGNSAAGGENDELSGQYTDSLSVGLHPDSINVPNN